MEIKELYNLYTKSYKVVKDTRDEVADAIYFSLKGDTFDGNQYALQALEKGANYAVIDDADYLTDDRMILVDDALTCLQHLATYHRQQLNIPIIALTGSNGKTTTKELISGVLSRTYQCQATKGNLNNHIGVPLTLLSINPTHDIAVIEMGANHVLEIDKLCEIALPDYGYISNFGRVHLEGFGSFEGVIQGKTEMYRHIKKHDKKVFVNSDDPLQMEKTKEQERIVFGTSSIDYKVDFLGVDPFVNIRFDGVDMHSELIGNYNFSNIAAAVSIGKYFDVPVTEIKKAIEAYVPQNNRSQILKRHTNSIILDAYNANPNSMEVAIDNLTKISSKKKVAILGDMFELGDDSLLEHQKVVDQIVEADFDQTYLIGAHFAATKTPKDKLIQCSTFDEFTEIFQQKSFENTTFLIKASRGMALERVLEYL